MKALDFPLKLETLENLWLAVGVLLCSYGISGQSGRKRHHEILTGYLISLFLSFQTNMPLLATLEA